MKGRWKICWFTIFRSGPISSWGIKFLLVSSDAGGALNDRAAREIFCHLRITDDSFSESAMVYFITLTMYHFVKFFLQNRISVPVCDIL